MMLHRRTQAQALHYAHLLPACGGPASTPCLVWMSVSGCMQDQTLGLAALGIQGTALTSLTDKDEAAAIYKRLDDPKGDICLLYGAPPRC